MTADELKARHSILSGKMITTNVLANKQTKLSIQFAIEILEELNQTWVGDSKMIHADAVQNKAQELKQYLDEKV
jgi:hypothetical protein